MRPKVSVVVPVYNCEKTLEKCVESIQKQTLREIEIWLIDDGSTDSSGIICDRVASEDKRIKVYHQENHGVGSARNVGLEKSSGIYIGFVDSDDWIDVEMFKVMYEEAIENDLDIVRCNTYMHRNGNVSEWWLPEKCEAILCEEEIRSYLMPLIIAPENEGDYRKRLLKGCVSCIFRKEILEQHSIKFNDLQSGEDMVFTMEALWHSKRVKLLKKSFYHYIKQTSGSLSISVNRIDKYWEKSYARECVENLVRNSVYYPIFLARWEQEDRRNVFLYVRIATIYNPSADGREKKQLVKKILNSEKAVCAFKKPIRDKLPIKMSILYFLCKHRLVFLLYVAVTVAYSE